jgi:hypothetical protein
MKNTIGPAGTGYGPSVTDDALGKRVVRKEHSGGVAVGTSA